MTDYNLTITETELQLRVSSSTIISGGTTSLEYDRIFSAEGINLILTAGDPLVEYSNPKEVIVRDAELQLYPGHIDLIYNRIFEPTGTELTLTAGDPGLYHGWVLEAAGINITLTAGNPSLAYLSITEFLADGVNLSLISGDIGLTYNERFFPTYLPTLHLTPVRGANGWAKLNLTIK